MAYSHQYLNGSLPPFTSMDYAGAEEEAESSEDEEQSPGGVKLKLKIV